MKRHDLEQGTQAWLDIRCGLPTASDASKIITSSGAPSNSMKDYAIQLADNTYAVKDLQEWQGNQYTDRGIEIELNARAAYELHNNIDIEQVGFVTDDMGQYGASPDGFIGNDGLVEFKCLPKQHTKSILYYKKYNKPPVSYIAQVQMQLLVTQRLWCDLNFYSDDLPDLTIRIEPDSAFLTALETQLKNVIAERNLILKTLREL